MIVNLLTLKNFRNHSFITFDFKPGLNIITGSNAVGKTNLVESISYLSFGKSFRTSDINDLIQKNQDNAKIECNISEGKILRNFVAILTKDGHKIYINKKPIKKLSDLYKTANVIVFEPKDVLLFRDLPKERRNFLDTSISKKSLSYLEYLTEYEKLLKQRNDILKAEKLNTELLEATTELLIKTSYNVVKYRQQYVEDINDILNKVTRALTGAHEKFELHYYPYVKLNSEFESNAKSAFKKALENDLRQKATTIGPHREDLSMSLNGKDIGQFGSQGENRIAALALKLAPYFLIEEKEKKPIVILDDVLSELDKTHQTRLIAFLKKFEQVFITATELNVEGSNHYQIKTKD